MRSQALKYLLILSSLGWVAVVAAQGGATQQLSALELNLLTHWQQQIRTKNLCSIEGKLKLSELFEYYPSNSAVSDVYRKMLLVCEDWDGLLRLVDLNPQDTAQWTLDKTKLLIKLNRYSKAAALIVPLCQADPTLIEAIWLSAYSLYHTEASRESIDYLDKYITIEQAEKLNDARVLRALLHMSEWQFHKAENLLKLCIESDPKNISAYNALGRALYAMDRKEEAVASFKRVRDIQSGKTALEGRQLRLSSLSYKLNEAWEIGNIDEVATLVDRMWPDADPGLRVQLTEFRNAIAEIRLGNQL